MKKILKVILISSISVLSLIGILIGVFLVSNNLHRKQMVKERDDKITACNKNLKVTGQLHIELFQFNNYELNKLKFEIIRNNESIKDTIILGVKNEEFITSIMIPFNNFLRSDTIKMTTNNGLGYTISNFNYNVRLLYGMFGPVATAECAIINSFTINGNQNTYKIVKYFGILENDSLTRISDTNSAYKSIVAKLTLNEEQIDSISNEINSAYRKAGYGSNYGIERSRKGDYYIRGFKNPENDSTEIIKINAETGAFTKPLKNYPIENKFETPYSNNTFETFNNQYILY